jgi:hypothetical protein
MNGKCGKCGGPGPTFANSEVTPVAWCRKCKHEYYHGHERISWLSIVLQGIVFVAMVVLLVVAGRLL